MRPLPIAAAILALAGRAVAQPAPMPPLDPPPAPAPQAWREAHDATLRLLNKVNAHVAILRLRAGESTRVGSLTIALRSCLARPGDMPADWAAFVVVEDSHPGNPPFHGWLLADEPGVSMLEHPVYGLQLAKCS